MVTSQAQGADSDAAQRYTRRSAERYQAFHNPPEGSRSPARRYRFGPPPARQLCVNRRWRGLYKVAYERDHKALKAITEPRPFETQFQSPQLLPWELQPEDWHLVLRLPED